jgi:regulator of protease activity HflC (stomatin/prohibitin superfamily)
VEVIMGFLRSARAFFRKSRVLIQATLWATLLGVLETVGTERGRRVLAVVALALGAVGLFALKPVRTVPPGEIAVRTNRLTGRVTLIREGWATDLPLVHDVRFFPLRDQIYHPTKSARADGSAPFQTVEGLSIGVDVSVRYALDPARVVTVSRELPADLGRELVEPAVDEVLHRTFAKNTVRDIFSTRRVEIQKEVEDELRPELLPDGILVKTVFIGSVDLPAEYRSGLEAMLSEELSSEKMRYTLALKDQEVKEAGLQADADKLRREKAAEAAALEQVIAAKAQEEAMAHVLPFKAKEIEQRRLEAEAAKITRVKQAEGEAEARRIEAAGEADGRRKLAEAEAFRIDATGKAQSAQLERDSALIAKNPLVIQKTIADKLSDKIQVIIAPPQAGGFIAGGLVGPLGSPGATQDAKQDVSRKTAE